MQETPHASFSAKPLRLITFLAIVLLSPACALNTSDQASYDADEMYLDEGQNMDEWIPEDPLDLQGELNVSRAPWAESPRFSARGAQDFAVRDYSAKMHRPLLTISCGFWLSSPIAKFFCPRPLCSQMAFSAAIAEELHACGLLSKPQIRSRHAQGEPSSLTRRSLCQRMDLSVQVCLF